MYKPVGGWVFKWKGHFLCHLPISYAFMGHWVFPSIHVTPGSVGPANRKGEFPNLKVVF